MNILFITATRIGDAILSTGLLDHMQREYPDGKVTVACGHLCASLFDGFPNIVRVIPMRKEPFHGHWIKLWRQVAGTRWDMVVDVRNSAVSRLIRARRRYVFGPHIDKNRHKVEQMAQLMALPDVPAPRLFFTPAQQDFARRLVPRGGRVLAVAPAANWIGKTWPAENFIEVIQWMTAPDGLMPGARVAVFAAPGEEAQAQPVLESIPPERRIDGIGKGTPGEAACAISACDFFIGNDSGLMHAAAVCGVKTVGVFGPSWPHLYRPWGPHTAYAATPQTFVELTDFPGYDPKTLRHSLMTRLKTSKVIDIINKVWHKEGDEAPDQTQLGTGRR